MSKNSQPKRIAVDPGPIGKIGKGSWQFVGPVPPEIHTALADLAVSTGKRMHVLTQEAILAYLQSHLHRARIVLVVPDDEHGDQPSTPTS